MNFDLIHVKSDDAGKRINQNKTVALIKWCVNGVDFICQINKGYESNKCYKGSLMAWFSLSPSCWEKGLKRLILNLEINKRSLR